MSEQEDLRKESKNTEGTNKTTGALPRKYNNPVFYGDSSEVTPVGLSDYNEMVHEKERKQSMKGFDPQYADFVDYIVKITHQIWEEKGIGIIYQTYHNEVKMHTGSMTIHGVQEVVSGTLQTLHAFPDRKLVAENVIWSGNDQDGFFSSHRVISTATNLGDSSFGSATGKKVAFRTIIDCLVHANRIVEEWLVRDNLYLVKQLGLDPVEVAKNLAAKTEIKKPALMTHFGLSQTRDGQMEPRTFQQKHKGFEIGEFAQDLFNKIWEWKLINRVKDFYAENAVIHYVCDQELIGHQQIQGMYISFFASFPNAGIVIERINCNQGAKTNEWEVSVRWVLHGLHEGFGYFGTPSGKRIEMLGISHFSIVDEKVQEEWVVFDGLDVLRQIHASDEKESVVQPEKYVDRNET